MTARRPTAKQVTSDIDYVIEMLERLRRDTPELLRRAEHRATDGYPSRSMSDGGGTADSSSVERAALSDPPADPVLRWTQQAFRSLHGVLVAAQAMDGSRGLVMTTGEPERGRQSTIPTCANRNCGIDLLDGVDRGRCRNCADYLRAHDRDRPGVLIEAERDRSEVKRRDAERKVAS